MKRLSLPVRFRPPSVRVGLGLGMVLLFVLHGAHVVTLPLVENFEGVLYDARVRATMPDTINPQIVIIDIDEKSLKEEGRWPWNRERLGDLVSKLSDHYKVAVVGMDVVFAEAESKSGVKLMERLSRRVSTRNKEMTTLLARLQQLMDGDEMFARAMKGRNVVMGYYFKRADNIEADNHSGKLPAPACDADEAAGQGLKLQAATGYGANLPVLQGAAAGGGHFIPNVDSDGIIRSIPLLMEFKGKCYESLSLAILRRIVEAPQVTVVRGGERWSRHSLEVGELKIPVTEDASALIPYRGFQGSFPYVSAVDVLEGRVDPKRLEGVVALLGTTAAGLLDSRTTPVGNTYPGVEVHANMVAGMLDGSIKKMPTAIAGLETWMLLFTGLAVAVLLGRANPMQVIDRKSVV